MPSPLAPPFVLALIAAVLYARGARRQRSIATPARRPSLRWRELAFWVALVTLVAALDSSIDDLADRLFWVHMLQHVLLMMVVAPLLALAAPWTPIWRGLSLRVRRPLASAVVARPAVRAGARAVGPWAIFVLFNLDLWAWHLPALYGLTLRQQAVHDLQHVSFLLLGVLFWAQVIESPPLRMRLDQTQRLVYVLLGATLSWLLALVLAFWPTALYAGYSELASRPGGISALGDQQLAAGIMLGPGSIPYAVFVFLALYRWLAPEPAAEARVRPRPSRPRTTPRPHGPAPAARARRS
jgi:cytochrome c oxidase assembly factor CtaG